MIPLPKLTHTGSNAGATHSELDNSDVKLFLNELDAMHYSELPSWIDDCFAGAAGQMTGSRIRPSRIFGLVRSLESISSGTVGQAINRKRLSLGDAPYSERYCRMVAQACRCASQAIKHHRNYHSVEREPELAPVAPLPYSADEMRHLKHLSLNASFSELGAYEAQLKAKYSCL